MPDRTDTPRRRPAVATVAIETLREVREALGDAHPELAAKIDQLIDAARWNSEPL